MVVFLGKGSALWRGVVGLCPGCPEGGEWVEGASGTQHLSPALPGKGLRPLHSLNKSWALVPPPCY